VVIDKLNVVTDNNVSVATDKPSMWLPINDVSVWLLINCIMWLLINMWQCSY